MSVPRFSIEERMSFATANREYLRWRRFPEPEAGAFEPEVQVGLCHGEPRAAGDRRGGGGGADDRGGGEDRLGAGIDAVGGEVRDVVHRAGVRLGDRQRPPRGGEPGDGTEPADQGPRPEARDVPAGGGRGAGAGADRGIRVRAVSVAGDPVPGADGEAPR
ncbi:MAG: hypothetical protein F4Y86_10300 [Gammaproteobacteria bacterium]|nr:hypothetical protein [Gammaproteobacteria bacterium]